MIFNKKHAKIQSEIALETIENKFFVRCAARRYQVKTLSKLFDFDIQKTPRSGGTFSGVFQKHSWVGEKIPG